MSKVSRVIKAQKLYFRDKKGNIRNLYKADKIIYNYIFGLFFNKGGNARYSELNKDVKHWSNFKPLLHSAPENINVLVREKILVRGEAIISYNGSWQPLIQFTNLSKKPKNFDGGKIERIERDEYNEDYNIKK